LCPIDSMSRVVWEPMKPLAPVIRMIAIERDP
jgi:hypothetical protein